MSSPKGAPQVLAGQLSSLKDLGHNEIWLQNWLAEDPIRLGLGPVTILAQEISSPHGGSLDILAHDGDSTYFSVEVQLGEVDASHGFRVFDYWARNRDRYPSKTHVAVLITESASGRYRTALEALAEYVPLAVIELKIWKGSGEAVVVPQLVVANQEMGLGGDASDAIRTEADWKDEATEEAWALVGEFADWADKNLGQIRVDYSPKSYIGIRRGRRVWAPLWLNNDGARTYLPDPDLTHTGDPSPAFETFRGKLGELGIDCSWQVKYNAGANPISLRLRREDLEKAGVQELLHASFTAVGSNPKPYSEEHPVASVNDERESKEAPS